LDASAFEGQCVIAEGYAQAQKGRQVLNLAGERLGVFFENDGDWEVPLGSRVRVRGIVARRDELPVFVPENGEAPIQGIAVPEGTELESARQHWVLEKASVISFRTPSDAQGELQDRLNEVVELPGILWSRNGFWWFSYDGLDVHLDNADEFLSFERHGSAIVLTGTLSLEPRPRIDQMLLRAEPEVAEAFVIRAHRLGVHPGWTLEPCSDD
jgi:hypothetical protein